MIIVKGIAAVLVRIWIYFLIFLSFKHFYRLKREYRSFPGQNGGSMNSLNINFLTVERKTYVWSVKSFLHVDFKLALDFCRTTHELQEKYPHTSPSISCLSLIATCFSTMGATVNNPISPFSVSQFKGLHPAECSRHSGKGQRSHSSKLEQSDALQCQGTDFIDHPREGAGVFHPDCLNWEALFIGAGQVGPRTGKY